jgi:hypothetical protein
VKKRHELGSDDPGAADDYDFHVQSPEICPTASSCAMVGRRFLTRSAEL